VDTNRDPDIDDDPDFAEVAKKAHRVAKRVWAETRDDGRVKVRNKGTGNITYVNPETLKERSQDFEAVEDEEEDDILTRPLPDKFEPEEEEIGGEEKEDSPAARLINLKALLDLRHGTREDQEDFRVLMDSSVDPDDTEIDTLVDEDSPFLQWYSTVGELREDLRDMLEGEKKPKSKHPEKDRVDFLKDLKAKVDANPVIRKYFEALLNSKDKDSRPLKELAPGSFILDWYDTLGDLRKDIRDITSPAAPSEEAPKEEEQSEVKGLDDEKDRIDFLKEMREDIASDPANRKQLEEILESKDDSSLLQDLFPGSPVAKQYKTVGDLRKDLQDLAHIEPPKSVEPSTEEKVPKEEEGPDGELAFALKNDVNFRDQLKSKLSELDRSETLSALVQDGKTFVPYGIISNDEVLSTYKTVGDLQDAVRKHLGEETPTEEAAGVDDGSVDVDIEEDDGSEDVTFDEPEPEPKVPEPKKPTETKSKLKPEAKKRLDDWMSIEGPKDRDFRDFAKGMPGVRERDGQIVIWDNDRDELVPFEDIGESKQWDMKRLFDRAQSAEKNHNDLREKVQKDPRLQQVLLALSNPKSPLSEKLKDSLKKDPRTIPELKDLDLPDSINFVEDLVSSAQKLYKPAKALKRRKFSKSEQIQAITQLVTTLPVDVVQKMMGQNLHPDDISELISNYHLASQSKPKSMDDAIKMVGGSYATTPEEVTTPPRFGKSMSGDEVPYAELSPEEQAEAMRVHQIRTAAISLAARESVIQHLERKTGAPEEILGSVADFMLKRPKNENPAQRLLRGQKEAKASFYNTLKGGAWDDTDNSRFDEKGKEVEDEDDRPSLKAKPLEFNNTQVRRLLDTMSDDPAGQQMVVGILQGADYHNAKVQLAESADEHQPVSQIQSALKDISKYLDNQSKRYPAELRWVNDPGYILRQQVVEKVRTLAPEKYPFMLKWSEKFEDEQYDRRSSDWEKTFKEGSPYREQGLKPPPRPVEPVGYSSRQKGSSKKNEGRSLVEEHRRQSEIPEEKPKTTAEDDINRAYRQKYSSYPQHLAMVNRVIKRAVFWGVEDSSDQSYPEGHLESGEKDFSGLVSAARTWLKTPVLSENVEGLPREAQVQAALDLAIREYNDGQYSAGLPPTEYDMLLGRLGVKKTACGSGGCTCGGQCSCGSKVSIETLKETSSMKASSELRSLAKRIASTNPELAYDIVDISERVAQQEEQQAAPAQDQKEAGLPPEFLENIKKKEDGAEDKGDDNKKEAGLPPEFLENIKKKEDGAKDDDKGQSQEKQAAYSTLRSHVIRMASANPNLREAYKPLLETIKQLGKG
jgi:hypothetical protein